jgi:hypothetical protein
MKNPHQSQRRRSTFNMIEIVLALGVIAIGMVSILGLLPVGANASRDAMAETYAGITAEQMLTWVANTIRTSDANWTSYVNNGASSLIPTSAGDIDDFTPVYVAGQTIYSKGGAGNEGVYKVIQYVDADTDGVYDTDELIDFEAIVAVTRTQISIGATTIPYDNAVALKAEIGWPAQIPSGERETTVYHLEIFKR